MLDKVIGFFNEYLRINAIRRMLNVVEVRRRELVGLVSFAVLFAAFEGVGLSLLLPILQYAQSGPRAIEGTSGTLWTAIKTVVSALHLPLGLVTLLVLAFVPILLRQVVFYLNAWYSAIVANRIGVRMRMQTLDAVLNADAAFFDRWPVGELVGVTVSQTETAGDAILAVINQLSIGLLMLMYLGIMVALSLPLSAIALLAAVFVGTVAKHSIKRTRAVGIKAAEATQRMTGKVVERFGLMRLVKLRDQKREESRIVEHYSETVRAIRVKQARYGANIEVTADPLLLLSVFVTLYFGITTLGMSLAQLGLLMFVLTRLSAKMKEFNNGRQLIAIKMAGLLLVQKTTADALASNSIRRGPVPFTGLAHRISFEDVAFDYPATSTIDGAPLDRPTEVLRDISATIPAGSMTAIVGRSGAGKSTLVELLPRLRDVTAGRIAIDDVDVRRFDVGTLRRGIGYLTQEAMLFNETVRYNLAYGLGHEPTDEELRAALEGAHAEFVYDLPQGLQTRLGDRGVRFSGGERQRLALARVLLEDTPILILDEPTSALDSESEAYIQHALAMLRGDKTIIVVAHRLATVVKADQLLVVDDGRIVERGTHEELIARQGAYYRLFKSQLLT